MNMKQQIENIIKKILSENKGLPLDKLNGDLMERALETMNYQLKQSLGREEITSVSNTNVLTEEDIGVINDIILTEKASLIADEVLKVVESKKIYIRFGKIPESEKSGIYDGDNRKIGEEIGVSVYEGINNNGKIKLIIPSLTYNSCVSLSGCLKREMFIVDGEMVGNGSDGEPLLKNVKIIN